MKTCQQGTVAVGGASLVKAAVVQPHQELSHEIERDPVHGCKGKPVARQLGKALLAHAQVQRPALLQSTQHVILVGVAVLVAVLSCVVLAEMKSVHCRMGLTREVRQQQEIKQSNGSAAASHIRGSAVASHNRDLPTMLTAVGSRSSAARGDSMPTLPGLLTKRLKMQPMSYATM